MWGQLRIIQGGHLKIGVDWEKFKYEGACKISWGFEKIEGVWLSGGLLQRGVVIEQQRTETASSRNLLPKDKTRIEYKQTGTGDVWQEAVVISRAGKTSGTSKMWLNVQNIPQRDQQSMNFDLIDWKYKEEAVLMSDSAVHEVAEAKH